MSKKNGYIKHPLRSVWSYIFSLLVWIYINDSCWKGTKVQVPCTSHEGRISWADNIQGIKGVSYTFNVAYYTIREIDKP